MRYAMKRFFGASLFVLLALSGCAHNLISDKSLAQVDSSISFNDLLKNPDAYRGKMVILGGGIAGVTSLDDGIQIEVINYNLDARQMPVEVSTPGGRFQAFLPESLNKTTDIFRCKRGMLVSLAGEVTGKKVLPLKGADYSYPVITISEISIIKAVDEDSLRTWEPLEGAPRF